MGLVVSDNRKPLTPCPEGLVQGVCVDVIELGLCDTAYGPKEKIKVVWMTDQINPETHKPFMVSKRYTASLNDKAILCMDLQMWRGRKFTPDEKKAFDLEKLLGANCQLQIVHDLKEGGEVWGNVQAIVPIGPSMVKMRIPEGYVRFKDREDKAGKQGGAHGNSDTAVGF